MLFEHFNTLQWSTLALAAASFAIIKLWPTNWQRRVPGSIVALLAGTLAVALFQIPVETIGSKFGGIPQGLPSPHLPTLSWENLQHLFQPAMTIALLCAVVADGMVDDRHDSNAQSGSEPNSRLTTRDECGLGCLTLALASRRSRRSRPGGCAIPSPNPTRLRNEETSLRTPKARRGQ